jgi:hypothetical protein
MRALQDRLKYMRWVEAASAFVLPLLFWNTWYQRSGHFAWELRIASLAVVSYILLQGALYWHLKIRSIDARLPLPAWFWPLFMGFKWSNVVAMLAVLAALVAGSLGAASRVDLAWAWGLLAFALLEHINYYHYQLMYDTRAIFASLRQNGRLRRAALGVDLAR